METFTLGVLLFTLIVLALVTLIIFARSRLVATGNVNITMKPNCSITWQDPGLGNLDLPGVYNHFTSIHNWSIQ